MRLLHSVARLYNTNFDRRPVATLVVTNGVLNTIADVLVSSRTHSPSLHFHSLNLIFLQAQCSTIVVRTYPPFGPLTSASQLVI